MEQVLIALIPNLPAGISTLIAVSFILIGAYIYIKRVDIDSKVSTSSIELKRIDSLMSQIDSLTNALSITRDELQNLHSQNMELIRELRGANLRISELETIIRQISTDRDK